jgi:acetolactate synthase-1/2/3 large subunit
MDIFSEVISSETFDRIIDNTRALVKPSIDDETARQIITKLAEAENAVTYAGGGILLAQASEELRAFTDHMGLPVAHSLMGKGALRDDHPLVLGMTGFWGTELTNQTCLNADYIFAIGTRFKEADCSSWYPGYTFNVPGSKIIHVDIEPSEIGRNYPTEIGVVADAKSALRVLTRVAKEMYPDGFDRTEMKAKIVAFRKSFKADNVEMQTSDAFPMMPERILADTRIALPNDAIITTDVGWNKNGVGQQFDILTPGSILTPGGFATMGFGPPAAIGAKLASPERVVLSLVGDGGFGQNPSMLATAVEMDLGIIWLVMNNNAFGTIAGLQKAHYGLTYGTTFPGTAEKPSNGPNYAEIARAYGAVGIKVNDASELLPALQMAINSGKPTVLDVAMINNPTPTTGHWNILDIYSPDKEVSHVATD